MKKTNIEDEIRSKQYEREIKTLKQKINKEHKDNREKAEEINSKIEKFKTKIFILSFLSFLVVVIFIALNVLLFIFNKDNLSPIVSLVSLVAILSFDTVKKKFNLHKEKILNLKHLAFENYCKVSPIMSNEIFSKDREIIKPIKRKRGRPRKHPITPRKEK